MVPRAVRGHASAPGTIEAMSILDSDPGPPALRRAYYSASIEQFLGESDDTILASLVSGGSFAIEATQRDAWMSEIAVMRSALAGLRGSGLIAFEFVVPRAGRRIDVLVIVQQVIFVIEFKVGERHFTQSATDQVWDYALDLKNFHSTSHNKAIVPVLIATEARVAAVRLKASEIVDGVLPPVHARPEQIGEVVEQAQRVCPRPRIDTDEWAKGRYTPTPTIIEAAKALYGGHGVAAIRRRGAEASDLTKTAAAVEQIIRQARENSHKAICFVTGVPGAGKTLVGLDVATRHIDRKSELYSVYLSGNGPLVKVLCEALARDKQKRLGTTGGSATLGALRSEVRAFIQNVHHFRDECVRDANEPPVEHVSLFDEAQRAWNREQTESFMRRKKGIPGFTLSEPEFLIQCMDRHKDWAVVVCLVGGGQEINTGEAGIAEWIRAVVDQFPSWHVHLSCNLHDSEYGAGEVLRILADRAKVHIDDDLHLAVSMRSFRAERLSSLVKALLDLEVERASELRHAVCERYPIVITRDLAAGKHWVRSRARGTERFGLMVSSQAQRLKPHAIDVRAPIDPVHWFLHPKDDVRSSYYLEDAATEFHVQGLEVDWGCVVWDGDLRHGSSAWDHWSFHGTKWRRIRAPERQAYLKNAYRVLLTRARQGMVIVVPEGEPDDPTRAPSFYDSTYEYLRGLGFDCIG